MNTRRLPRLQRAVRGRCPGHPRGAAGLGEFPFGRDRPPYLAIHGRGVRGSSLIRSACGCATRGDSTLGPCVRAVRAARGGELAERGSVHAAHGDSTVAGGDVGARYDNSLRVRGGVEQRPDGTAGASAGTPVRRVLERPVRGKRGWWRAASARSRQWRTRRPGAELGRRQWNAPTHGARRRGCRSRRHNQRCLAVLLSAVRSSRIP